MRHPFLFLVPIIVLAAAGAALGLSRTPTYTTESRVSVTRLDVQTQALPGYAQAARSLASAYARNVEGTGVQECVARRADEGGEYADQLTGTVIPESPVIRVISEAPSAKAAKELADVGAECLVRDVSRNGAPDNSEDFLTEYRKEVRKQAELRREVADLKEELGEDEESSRLDRLEANLASQRLVVSSMAQRYSTESSQQQQVQNVGVLASATNPTSDKNKQVAIFAFTGGVAGLLLGLLLASARMRRKERRASQDARAD